MHWIQICLIKIYGKTQIVLSVTDSTADKTTQTGNTFLEGSVHYF
jgi:hypothetical protein